MRRFRHLRLHLSLGALLAATCFHPLSAHAADTSLEIDGLIMYLDRNRVTGMGMVFEELLYDSATGGTVLKDFGQTYVDVVDGVFHRRLGPIDDSLLAAPTFLQMTVNGFAMTSRLPVLSFEGRHWIDGHARQDALFQVYAGYAVAQAVPEPVAPAMLLAGLAVLRAATRRRNGTPAA